MKRACFIPLVTECYISCLCYMLCSVVKLKKAMHAQMHADENGTIGFTKRTTETE